MSSEKRGRKRKFPSSYTVPGPLSLSSDDDLANSSEAREQRDGHYQQLVALGERHGHQETHREHGVSNSASNNQSDDRGYLPRSTVGVYPGAGGARPVKAAAVVPPADPGHHGGPPVQAAAVPLPDHGPRRTEQFQGGDDHGGHGDDQGPLLDQGRQRDVHGPLLDPLEAAIHAIQNVSAHDDEDGDERQVDDFFMPGHESDRGHDSIDRSDDDEEVNEDDPDPEGRHEKYCLLFLRCLRCRLLLLLVGH